MFKFDWSDKVIDRVAELLKQGHTGAYIADEIGATRSSVIAKVHRNKILAAIGFGTPSTKVQSAEKKELAKAIARAKAPAIKKAKHTFHAVNLKARKAAQPPVMPVFPDDLFNADALRLTLLELGPRQCKWDVANPKVGEEYLFCGKPTDDLRSWCPHHQKLAFSPRPYKAVYVRAVAA